MVNDKSLIGEGLTRERPRHVTTNTRGIAEE
jgi:hypothetical protein